MTRSGAKYDDASWHYGGNFPKGLAPECACTHIGMYFVWALERGLIDPAILEGADEWIEQHRRAEIGCGQLVELVCDGKLVDGQFTEIGSDFSNAYYDKHYFEDYAGVASGNIPTIYHVKDDLPNYQRIARRLDQRFAEWERNRASNRSR